MVDTRASEVLRDVSARVPARLVLAIMAFTACWSLYMLRVNLSVTIIAMSYPPPAGRDPECRTSNTTAKNATLHDFGPRYDWSEKVQGDVLAAFSYGYFLTQFPGGMIAERFGARLVVFACMVVMAVFTALTPLSAQWHWGAVMGVRIVIGLAGGAIYPALHAIIAQWAPPEEKSKFIWALLGGTFGTVVTFPLCGVVVEAWGWPASFYLCAGLAGAWSFLWLLLVRNTPAEHPRISSVELTYIQSRIGTSIARASSDMHGGQVHVQNFMPLRKVFTSIPFLALLLLHFGNLWGLFFLLTMGPKFMKEALDFNLTDSGGLSSLPYLARAGFGFLFSWVGDYMVQHNTASRTFIRKIFVLFSHLIPGALVLALGYIGCEVTWSVVVLTLSLGMNGAATVSNLANHHDLAPNFAGSLYGIMNALGSTTGFIAPAISGRILEENNGLKQWRIIFTIGAAFYLITGVIYIIFGSGNMQPWNFPEARPEPLDPDEQEQKPETTPGPAPAQQPET